MKIDYKKLNETGRGLLRPAAVLHYVRAKIEYLYTHNKNLTCAQWDAVVELKEIIDNIDIEK